MGTEAQLPAVAVREGSRRETSANETASERVAASRAPLLALGAIVAGAFVVYSLLATLVDVPRVHPDEVRYLIGASSIVEGEGLTQRGHEYGFGPLYALFLAAILLVTGGADAGYDALKAGNALVFALTAVPVYLLARRLVSEWWAVLAAGLSVAIPSSISIATVMTESLAYLTAIVALLAIARALEDPSVGRQLAMLAAIGAAFLTRPQFGSHFLVWLGGLALVWLLLPSKRPRTRADLVRYWPTALPLALAAAVVVGRSVAGSDQSESFGAYWELWRGYDPVGVGKWLLYHLADFEIYLAVVPLAVAPVVLWSLLKHGRAGSGREAAFAALFLAANAVGLFVVAAFNSTPYAYDRLHDRYVFYLLPLWLIVFVAWLAEGMPRPVVALATGVVLALALPAILPFRQLANEAGIDTVPGALWIWIESQLAGPGPLSGRVALAVFVLGLLAAAVLLPARFRLVLPAVVLAVFLAMGVAAWERIADAPEDLVFAGGLERDWIDDRVPDDAVVWKLYLESEACPATALTRHSLFATEFFNESVDRAAYIGASIPDGIEIDHVNVGTGGAVVLAGGEPLEAEFVYTQPGIELTGQKVAMGTAANLVLWRVGGRVRIVGAESNGEVRTEDCGAA